MCGIAGFWNPQTKNNQAIAIAEKMANSLDHRGPDGSGYHFDASRGLSMAHTRLSIIDLETGEQPLFDKEAKLAMTVNGEFYDYKRIRGMLKLEGFSFTTKSDSEIALKLYRKHGLDMMEHLRGEFSFALFDEQKERLILGRDRFGIRPMFFYLDEKQIVYGSEIKALLNHPDVPRDISKKAQLHQMMQVMVPGDTLFEGIHALLPGNVLIIDKNQDKLSAKQMQYWDAEFPMQDEHPHRSDQEAIELVREKMVESVGFRLEADVPVACYLSGGIDSCSILGMAASIQQSPVKAFTISFDDDRYDESSIAKKMAALVNADQDILNIKAADLYGENFEKTLWHSERTFYNTLGVAKMLMSKHVRDQNIKVVITGEGSDEIFGGYAAFKRDMFLHDPKYKQSDMLAKMTSSNQVFQGSILAEKDMNHEAFADIMGFTPSWLQPWMLVFEQLKPLLSSDTQDLLREYDPIAALAESLDAKQLKGRHPLDKSQYSWIKTMLEGQILQWGGDRVDMANSLESRPAFLDHHVVEAALTIDPHQRIREGIEKWVLREAMKHVLPVELYEREKFAFMAPPAHTDQEKKTQVDSLIKKYLSPDKIDARGLLNSDAFSAYLHENKDDHAFETRKDIIINHSLCVHALSEMFA